MRQIASLCRYLPIILPSILCFSLLFGIPQAIPETPQAENMDRESDTESTDDVV